MFEYAAALGLLARDGGAAVQFLVEHLKKHPDDLFTGAVLEQALIEGLSDPLESSIINAAIEEMAGSQLHSLQRIALAVAAHHPQYTQIANKLIDTVEPAALRRYVQIAPTITDIDIGQQVAHLVRVWKKSSHVREAVLESFVRLADREPAVAGSVDSAYC